MVSPTWQEKFDGFKRDDLVRISKEGGINKDSVELLDVSDYQDMSLDGTYVGYLNR